MVKGTAYNIENPVLGEYTLTVVGHKTLAEINSFVAGVSGQKVDIKHGYAILYNVAGDRIYSHLASYTMQQGDQVRDIFPY